ncbi:MAG: PrgI family protein [Chloroflexi bacterium]|nr:PrgI family protein [Chloroflexota bacterium]
MARLRHEIPTHLNVEDRAIFGLTLRQVMFLAVGIAGSYGLWMQWPELSVGLRLGAVVSCLLATVSMALVRPHGRGLEEWGIVLAHYLATPKKAVWRPRQWEDLETEGGRWADLCPGLDWQEQSQ